MKKILSAILISAVLFTGCANPSTKEGAQKIAEKWVKQNASTYVFDGYDLKHTKTFPLSCDNCWKYEFLFKSSNSGYGDRTGQALDKVITDHRIQVLVENGEITDANVDNAYDEISKVPAE
ncbi:MAG: hypothetical protein WC873_01450 [Candidatus Gracilibacteria bacterium]